MDVDTLLMWVVGALVAIIGIPFTLWWWKIADKWADAEKRRFKPKEDTRERIVIRDKSDPTPET